MTYSTKTHYQEEIHPWKPYIPVNADKLILGTFPTDKRNRGEIDFYYPNPNNKFWRVLSAVADNTEHVDVIVDTNKNQRITILEKLNLGIADMGYKVIRRQNSSVDSSLFVTEYTNIFSILDANPKITKLIFCSSSGPNSVEGWFRSYCELNDVYFPKLKGKNPKRTDFIDHSRSIKIVSVHSTSGTAGRGFDELVDMYSKEIIQIEGHE